MKRIFVIICFSLIFVNSWSVSKVIHPLKDTPEFREENAIGWHIPNLNIKGGSAINPGFSVTIEFSTPQNYDTNTNDIFVLGAFNGSYFEPAINFAQKGDDLIISRLTKLGPMIRMFENKAWTSGLLERGKNYTLKFEIDETRCLTSIWETGCPSKKNYEYTFYGLMGTVVKEILSKGGNKLAITLNKEYLVQYIFIKDLGVGVGVQVPSPTNEEFYAKLENKNSKKVAGLLNYSTANKNKVVESSDAGEGTTLWKIIPTYSQRRTPIAYDVEIFNMASHSKMVPERCNPSTKSPIVINPTSNCSSWKFVRDDITDTYFKISNIDNSEYVSIAATKNSANIFLSESSLGHNTSWEIAQEIFPSFLKDGFYYIQHKKSGLYLGPKNVGYNNDGLSMASNPSKENLIWYVYQNEKGVYYIQNIDTKEYVTVKNSSMQNNAPVIQEKYNEEGKSKWILTQQGNTDWYTVENLTSGQSLAPQDTNPKAGSPIVQKLYGEIGDLWEFKPVQFLTGYPLGGVFRIRNQATDTYLVVENAATSNGTPIISWTSADNPNGWWMLEYQENGAYAIKNINSGTYMGVKDASVSDGSTIFITDRDNFNNSRGYSLWTLEPVLGSNPRFPCYIRNVHSKKYLVFQKNTENRQNLIQSTMPADQVNNLIFGWEFERITMK